MNRFHSLSDGALIAIWEIVLLVLALPIVLELAAAQAPSIAPETLVAFAQAELGRDPLAVHDNATSKSHAPATVAEAIALATTLLRQGHSVDLGLLQINDANLSRTGLTVAMTFEPGRNIGAGTQIMVAAYRQCQAGRSEPDTLRCMASIYKHQVATGWDSERLRGPRLEGGRPDRAGDPAPAAASPPIPNRRPGMPDALLRPLPSSPHQSRQLLTLPGMKRHSPPLASIASISRRANDPVHSEEGGSPGLRRSRAAPHGSVT